MGILNRIVVGTTPWMPKFIVGRIASVYVAGDKLEDGLNLVRKLNKKGFVGTLDLLGEEVRNRRGITKTTKSYCDLIEGIANAGVDCNISLKLTAFGCMKYIAKSGASLLDSRSTDANISGVSVSILKNTLLES